MYLDLNWEKNAQSGSQWIPDEDELGTFSVGLTRDWKWNKNFNVQLNPDDLAEQSAVDVGNYVIVTNPHNDLDPAVYGRIDSGEHLERGEVGIGFDVRHALGVPRENAALNTVKLYHREPEPKSRHRRFFDSMVRFRPTICRVRYAVHPDIGFEICRLPEETFDVLGIEPGDRVFVQSANDRTNLKALVERNQTKERKEQQCEQNPDHYQDCQQRLGIEAIAGTEVDVPRIYLDKEQRENAGLPDDAMCQPIVVYRDSRAYFLRKLNDVTIPILGGILGFVVVFEGVLGLQYLAGALVVAITLIIFSVFYQVRFESLD